MNFTWLNASKQSSHRAIVKIKADYIFSRNSNIKRLSICFLVMSVVNLVAFSNPDESLLVPESIYILSVLSGGLQSTRRSQVYSDYRRFVTGGRVVDSAQ